MQYSERLKQQRREATQRWRERNPDKVKAANRKPRKRIYDPQKSKYWREKRLSVPGYREKVNQKANDRATAIRRWLDNYKLERGCADCGFAGHPAALHFDHIGTSKTINVCNSKSLAQAQREIQQCIIRCANCHAIKTWPHLLVRK